MGAEGLRRSDWQFEVGLRHIFGHFPLGIFGPLCPRRLFSWPGGTSGSLNPTITTHVMAVFVLEPLSFGEPILFSPVHGASGRPGWALDVSYPALRLPCTLFQLVSLLFNRPCIRSIPFVRDSDLAHSTLLRHQQSTLPIEATAGRSRAVGQVWHITGRYSGMGAGRSHQTANCEQQLPSHIHSQSAYISRVRFHFHSSFILGDLRGDRTTPGFTPARAPNYRTGGLRGAPGAPLGKLIPHSPRSCLASELMRPGVYHISRTGPAGIGPNVTFVLSSCV